MPPEIYCRPDWSSLRLSAALEIGLDSILSFVGASAFAAPNTQASMDVVFVHGLGGDRLGTWRFSLEACWPQWVAEDFPNANVYCAGYHSSPIGDLVQGPGATLGDLATMLADGLNSTKTKSPSLVLIGHSLGGLVIKQMLRLLNDSSQPEAKALLARVKGIIFIATPHMGATLAKSLKSVCGLVTSNAISDLALGNETVLDLGNWFKNWAHQNPEVKVAAFYEIKKTSGKLVVDKMTANPNVAGCDPVGVDADHIAICKPPARDAHIASSVASILNNVCPASMEAAAADIAPTTADAVVPAHLRVMADEILSDFEFFTAIAPGDRRTLAQKLEDGGRRYEIARAERKKEQFSMAIQKHIAQPSALTRITRMMSEIETRFNRHARLAIAEGAGKEKVNQIIQKEVVDPIVRADRADGGEATASFVENGLYYLTGNCHVQWDNE
jgi:protein SERAC1